MELRRPPSIDAFGGGGFRVAGHRIEGSLVILDDQVWPWPVATLAEVTPQSLAAVIGAGRARVELLLLGVGPKLDRPPRELRAALQQAGIGLEYMDTPAACRTYNVLAGEGRRLAAALLAV